ncbi:hypothetical protein X753_31610 [Mesorhizobium sp. LNJC399B00]|nr:hypothetical protein X753_31610 [Mesorhizobium sp. LNJC399B00]
MTRLRGRCLKGQRLRSKAPFGHWKTQTFIAGLRCRAFNATRLRKTQESVAADGIRNELRSGGSTSMACSVK